MLIQESREGMQQLVWIWIALSAVVLLVTWNSKRPSVGLPLGYWLSITLLHFSGALAYAQPGYRPTAQMLLDNFHGFHTTFIGFVEAVIGLAGLVFGLILSTILVRVPDMPRPTTLSVFCQKLPGTLMVLSLVFFFVLFPIMRLVPSLGSLGSTGTGLSMVAACLGSWNAWLQHNRARIYLWLLGSSISFPALTLFFLGFTSFGVAAATVVWVFVLAFYRPRWIATLALIGLLYSGYTIYINYIRERSSIREAVWGRQDSANRLDRMANMFRNFEPFDWKNNYHLETLDARLNQNHLLGMSVDYIGSGRQGFAQGSTLMLAAVSWVPRILWPGKPSTAGSGGVVAMYTGLKFSAGTSVGVGHIMELYVNYGTACVFFGLMFVGFVLRWADIHAATYLWAGDYPGFIRWLIPMIGLLNVTGNFATAVASIAAGVVFTQILDRTIFARALAVSEWQQRQLNRRAVPRAS